MATIYKIAPKWRSDVWITQHGQQATADQIGTSTWADFSRLLNRSATAGEVFTNPIAYTYSLLYTAASAYSGGVLASNGDIYFVPNSAVRGQKISAAGTVSTYSLNYTATNAYAGGVLAPNGDIHFVPYLATVGQKVSASGTASTYSLAYTPSTAYLGGVLAPNGANTPPK